MYLPQEWADDEQRREKAGVPPEVCFQSKPPIASEQIGKLVEAGVPQAPVWADAADGNASGFRASIEELGLQYRVGVQSTMTVWPVGSGPLPAQRWKGKGRPTSWLRRDQKQQPLWIQELALALGQEAFCHVGWREGTQGKLGSRFAAVRVRPAHRDDWRKKPHAEQWLLMEWPKGDKEPAKYGLSNLPPGTSRKELVWLGEPRGRIPRGYQKLKPELGLGHYEGRGWRGFHHHATLCIAAYGFLVAERSLFPPSLLAKNLNFWLPKMPAGWQARGTAASARTA